MRATRTIGSIANTATVGIGLGDRCSGIGVFFLVCDVE